MDSDRTGVAVGIDPSPSDEGVGLISAIARGDKDAFETLYQLHSRALFTFLARTLDDDALAEEIVQDTFLAIWKSPSFGAHSSLRTWIFAIARRRVRDQARRARLTLVRGELEGSSTEPGPDEQAITNTDAADLGRQIALLPRIHREVLYLAFTEQLSHREIAEVLGVPVGTVKSRLDGARRSLRKAIDELTRSESDDD